MRTFPEAVDAFKAGDLSDADLYRTIMAHPGWQVVAEVDDAGATRLGVLRTPNGGRILELFSGADSLASFCAQEQAEMPAKMLQLPGFHLFGTLADAAVDRINLDLHSPHATHFLRDQIPLLRAWAEVVTVELALAAPDRLPNPFAALRRFDGFNVVIRVDGAERDFVMAPDATRMLAAVFTAEDTVDEFLAEVGETITAELGGELVVERMAGVPLFEALAQMSLDGIVFNPITHLPGVALAPGVIERVLSS